MRTEKECMYLGSMIAELNNNQLSLLFGMLIGAYLKRPESLFWEVLERFERDSHGKRGGIYL